MPEQEKVAIKKRKQAEHIRCQKVSTEEIKQGLSVSFGFETLTARWLSDLKTAQKKAQYELLGRTFTDKDKVTVTRQAVHKRIQRSKVLSEHKADIDESALDLGERQLIKLVSEGNLGAICFLLKCKGKTRGYIERQEMTGADGAPLVPKRGTYDLSALTPEEISLAVREAFKKEGNGGENK